MGCRLWGRTESDTTEATQQQQHWLFWVFITVHALLIAVASLVAEHRLLALWHVESSRTRDRTHVP